MGKAVRLRTSSKTRAAYTRHRVSEREDRVLKRMTFGKTDDHYETPDTRRLEGYTPRPRSTVEVWRNK